MNHSERMHGKRSMVDGLNDAIRDNPLGAGLIGAGVLWMLFGSRRMTSMGSAIPRAVGAAAGSVGAATMAGGRTVASGLGAAGSGIRDASTWVKDGVTETFASSGSASEREAEPTRIDAVDVDVATTTMADRARAAGDTMRDYAHTGMDYGNSLKDKLGAGIDKQPLLLGALGLAIGAGIASAFASTRLESDYMGEQSAAAREKIQEAVTEFKHTAQQVVEDVKQEAQAQGFTPDAAQGTLRDITERAKKVVSSTKDSIGNRT